MPACGGQRTALPPDLLETGFLVPCSDPGLPGLLKSRVYTPILPQKHYWVCRHIHVVTGILTQSKHFTHGAVSEDIKDISLVNQNCIVEI